jgi:hypothetical protein
MRGRRNTDLILRSGPLGRVSKDGRKESWPSFETPREERAAPQDEVGTYIHKLLRMRSESSEPIGFMESIH